MIKDKKAKGASLIKALLLLAIAGIVGVVVYIQRAEAPRRLEVFDET